MFTHKLKQLTHYLLSQTLCSSEQLDSYIESARLEPCSQIRGPGGIVIGHVEYQAVIEIERYFHLPETLLAHLSAWLQTYDDAREDLELPVPTIDVDQPSEATADVEINIVFVESIELIENEQGPLSFNETNWAIAPVAIDTAEEVAVGDSTGKAPDASYSNER